MWHSLIDRSLLQKLIISLSAIIHLEDWPEIWFVRGSWSHRCVRRRRMITCYEHFISSFHHMLMLIFLSIDPTLRWPADGVTSSSNVWSCEDNDGGLMMKQSANRLIFVLLLVLEAFWCFFIDIARFEPHCPTWAPQLNMFCHLRWRAWVVFIHIWSLLSLIHVSSNKLH